MSDDKPELQETKTVRVWVSGRVQGVWFRGWTIETATRLALDGWVRNRRDGTVEALFSGDTGSVDEMIELCHDGPTHARVVRIDVFDEPGYEGRGFEPRSTV